MPIKRMMSNFPDFLDADSTIVARQLLGCYLEREIDGENVCVRIVETESYDQTDAASHSYRGETPRTKVMFGPSGYLYVYFTYGMHYCCNIVTGPDGVGSAVLIRAVEPITGAEVLERRRRRSGVEVTNGPAKLCSALGVDRRLDGHDLRKVPLKLLSGERLMNQEIVIAKRIGISRARDELRRFYIRNNQFVSRKF